MFTKVTIKSNGKKAVRIVESIWDSKKQKSVQKTIRSLGVFEKDQDVEKMLKFAKDMIADIKNERNSVLPGMAYIHRNVPKLKKISRGHPFKVKKTITQGPKNVINHLFKQLKLDNLIEGTKKDEHWNYLLKLCVISRIFDPSSKRSAVNLLESDYNESVDLDAIYRMMDRLHPHIEKLKSQVTDNTLSLFNYEVDVLFYDVTTLYFESEKSDELREFGFSKDCKFKEVQVVLALVTNAEGHPITYELFPGNMAEAKTLTDVIKKLSQRFNVRNAVLVADRAMFSRKNLEVMDSLGVKYVVAAKLKTLNRAKKEEILDQGSYKYCKAADLDICFTKEIEHEKRRLIVSHSKKRARKDKAQRLRLIDRLMKKAKNNQIPITSLISNHGTKKFIQVQNSTATINQEKLEKEALWDGLHGVITNVKDKSAYELLKRYRSLWKIEEAFRLQKNDLKVRPIFHWKKKRIESHIAICFLAYSISYFIRERLYQKGLNLSLKKLKFILNRDRYSILEEKYTKNLYKLPLEDNETLLSIYKAFSLKRSSAMSPLTSAQN